MADAVLGTQDAAARLEALAREGVVASADDGSAYTYHPLLATFLRARLRTEVPDTERRALHARAADVLEQRGDWAEAAYHYRAAARSTPRSTCCSRDRPDAAPVRAARAGPAAQRRWPGPDRRDRPPRLAGGGEWRRPPSIGRPADAGTGSLSAARRPAGEQRALEAVIAAPPEQLSAEALATCYERLGELAAARDDRAAAARYLDLALALEREALATQSGEPTPATDVRPRWQRGRGPTGVRCRARLRSRHGRDPPVGRHGAYPSPGPTPGPGRGRLLRRRAAAERPGGARLDGAGAARGLRAGPGVGCDPRLRGGAPARRRLGSARRGAAARGARRLCQRHLDAGACQCSASVPPWRAAACCTARRSSP